MQGLRELSISGGCEVLWLKTRRYYRWLNCKPILPKKTWNRITPREEQAIVESGKDDDFTIQNQATVLETQRESSKAFTLLIGSIAAISLLVGGIGILAVYNFNECRSSIFYLYFYYWHFFWCVSSYKGR